MGSGICRCGCSFAGGIKCSENTTNEILIMEKERIINYISKHKPRICKKKLQKLSLPSLTMIEIHVMIEKMYTDKIKLN